MKKYLLLAILLPGCANFKTTQIDERTNAQTKEVTKVTTKASSWTFFNSKSQLGRWNAVQTESRQSATVGQLAQENNGTNSVAALEAIARGLATGLK